MLTLACAARTHQGRVRTQNEDSMLTTERFAVVADGLGGHASGEVASRIAVDRLSLLEQLREVHPDDVIAAIEDANRQIVSEVHRHREHEGMGTTLTGIGIVDVGGAQHWVVFNVGDSRVYRFAKGTLSQVTVDHSEVQELRAAGVIDDAAAATYPRRNVVTRCLGSLPAPVPDLWVFPPSDGERFLICSDGLTNEVDDDGIAAVLGGHAEPGDAADELLEQALDAGGRDNIAVVVVDLSEAVTPVDVDTSPRGSRVS